MASYQAVITGGGPAGLAAGIALARSGLRVLLVERKRFPVDKCCGEGVLPTGAAHLEDLGVTACLQPGDSFPIRGIRYHTPAGRTATGYFREGPGLGIPRERLSGALRARAEALPGLEICEGLKASAYSRQSGRMVVELEGRRASAPLLVGADGLNSGLRRWAGLDGPAPARRRWGARRHFGCPPWSDCVEVFWGRGIEAYITPCGPDRVSAAFLWDQARFVPEREGKDLVWSLLKPFPELRERLSGAPLGGQALAVGPLQRNAIRPAADGVALVGDASGYLDALTGEGISLALAQALALEACAAPRLQARGEEGPLLGLEELRDYVRAHRAICRPNRLMTRALLGLSRYPILVELAVSGLQGRSGLFSRLLSMNMGSAGFWPFQS